MSANYLTTGPVIEVHHEGETWWAACPECPGFSAAADSWDDLYRLVAEFHRSAEATHIAWFMVSLPWKVEPLP